MTELINGCSYTNIWVSPQNWATAKQKDMAKCWYIQYHYYDPNFKKDYPNGKAIRKKINKIKSLEKRKSYIRAFLKEMPILIQKMHFNPITKKYMDPPQHLLNNDEISPSVSFNKALDWALTKIDGVKTTMYDAATVVKAIKKAAVKLNKDDTPAYLIKRRDILFMIDSLEKSEGGFSGHKFNKFRTYLQIIYKKLVAYEVVETNIINDIEKRKVVKKVRDVLTLEERSMIYKQLEHTFPAFLDFIILFFHSGARVTEMLELKAEHVDLKKLRFKSLIKKGKEYRWVYRPIKKIALQRWENLLKNANKDDYVFSVGLRPGPQRIRREQIGRRWNMHVKKKLGITVNFYALKHLNLDEIAAERGLEAAALAAGHTDTAMVRSVYAVRHQDREMVKIQNMDNDFVPASA